MQISCFALCLPCTLPVLAIFSYFVFFVSVTVLLSLFNTLYLPSNT